MISSQELSRSLYGATRLAKGDADGIGYFNASLEGFWNSLTAAAIVLPGHIFIVWLSYLAVPAEASSGRIVLVEAIAFVIGWTGFQLALFYYCSAVGKPERFFHAAVSLNWIDVPLMALKVGQTLLILLGMPLGLADLTNLIIIILAVAYTAFTAKAALRSSIPVALGPVVIGIVIGVTIQIATARMTGQA